jgi:hypothetical protein
MIYAQKMYSMNMYDNNNNNIFQQKRGYDRSLQASGNVLTALGLAVLDPVRP